MQFTTEVILVLFLTTWPAFGMQTINVLYVNDIKNEVADKSMVQALKFFKHNTYLGIQIGTFSNITVRNDNAEELSELLLTEYNNSIYLNKRFHIVLDNTLRKPTSDVVKSFTADEELPTVSTTPGQTGDIKMWNNLKQYQLKYLIQISPPSDIIPEIVRSIVVTQNMTNAGIFYDDSFVMDHKYKSLLQNIAVRHTLIEINDMRSVKYHLTRLKETDIVNFFILGHLFTIKSVLKIADSNHFYGKTYAWHAITQDDGELCSNTSNITVLFVKPYHNTKTVENQDLSFNIINNNISSKVESSFYFDVVIHSILAIKSLLDSGEWVYNGSNETTLEFSSENENRIVLDLRKHFEKVKVPTSYSQFVTESNGKSFMEFNMSLEKVQIQNGQSAPLNLMGNWRAGLNSSIIITNFEGMANHSAVTVYKVVTALQEPFMMKEIDEFGNEKYSGYCVDLIEEIRKLVPFPFEYEMYTTPDNSFGFMSDSGNWNGMIKELIEKRADIALGSLTVLAERENVVDFTIAYYDLVGIAIMMKTFKSSTSLFKFLAVLETDVWLCILGVYFFTSFLIWIFDKWSPYSSQNTLLKCDEYDELPRRFNLIECLWFCMTSLTPQGGGEVPKNISGKLVSATWWLFGLLIISSYTANLAAFLTVSRLDTPIESLDDLYKQYKIQYAPVNGSAAMTYFQRMAGIEGRFREIWKEMSLNSSLSDIERAKLAVWEYPISNKYTKIWKAMTEAIAPNSTEDATLRVLASKSSSDGFAYLGDATEIRYQVMINCDLQRVGDEFSRKPYAIAVQKGSPLKDQFNTAILQLLNKRKLEQMKEQWWNLNPVNKLCKKPQEESDSISINNIGNNPDLREYTEPALGATKKVSHHNVGNIQTVETGGVFIVIFVGMCLACISLVLEYRYKFHKTTQTRSLIRKSKTHHHYQQKVRNKIFVKSNTSTEDQDTAH